MHISPTVNPLLVISMAIVMDHQCVVTNLVCSAAVGGGTGVGSGLLLGPFGLLPALLGLGLSTGTFKTAGLTSGRKRLGSQIPEELNKSRWLSMALHGSTIRLVCCREKPFSYQLQQSSTASRSPRRPQLGTTQRDHDETAAFTPSGQQIYHRQRSQLWLTAGRLITLVVEVYWSTTFQTLLQSECNFQRCQGWS